MILERLWSAAKGAGLGVSFGCLIICAVAVLTQDPRWLPLFFSPLVLGLMGLVIGFATSGKTPDQLRARALRLLHKECSRSRRGLEVVGSEVIQVGRDVTLGERADQLILAHFQRGRTRVDYLQTVHLAAPEGDFHLVIPWSGPTMLPHEFFCWMDGHLPSSVTLKRGAFGSWGSGRWVGPHGEADHPLARAAEDHPVNLNTGVEWDWEKGRYKIHLQWGVQAVPLSENVYVHFAQTALHGVVRSRFGLDWYWDRAVAFFLFVKELKFDMKQERTFLFQPKSLLVLHRMLGRDEEDILPLEDRLTRPASLEDLF
jgi:hypothetical protein